MQTVKVKMNAGDLKGIIDLPNYPDNQPVEITVSPELKKNSREIRLDILTEKIISARAKKNLEIMEEIQSMIGEDKGWENEEAMIQDLSERRRKNCENYA